MAEITQRCAAEEKWDSFNIPETLNTIVSANEKPDKAKVIQQQKRRFKT